MSVGTGNISLQEVVNEVNIQGVATLDDCFNYAAGGLNPLYAAEGQRLSEWKGYTNPGSGGKTYSMYVKRVPSTALDPCSSSGVSTTVYSAIRGLVATFEDEEAIYTDSDLTTVAPSGWYSEYGATEMYWFKWDASSQQWIDRHQCI